MTIYQSPVLQIKIHVYTRVSYKSSNTPEDSKTYIVEGGFQVVSLKVHLDGDATCVLVDGKEGGSRVISNYEELQFFLKKYTTFTINNCKSMKGKNMPCAILCMLCGMYLNCKMIEVV